MLVPEHGLRFGKLLHDLYVAASSVEPGGKGHSPVFLSTENRSI
jgi:hypothetical protein